MSGNPELNIDRVAELARLHLDPEEKKQYAEQLADVLRNIEKLSRVDITGVEPTAHAFPLSNVWDEDVAGPGLPLDEALRNAPTRRGNFVAVPRVVE